MFTKTELIEQGKHYFNDKSVNVMFATSDGNFFYEASKSYGYSHAKTRSIQLFEIKRDDLSKTKEANTTEDVEELTDLKKEAKELKIKGFALMKYDTLKAKVEELKN